MKRKYEFYVYIMASKSGTLYTGFTNNLYGRVYQHKNNEIERFTKKYQCHKLVYFEDHKYVLNAIAREKQIKKWNRKKKQDLIRIINPSWKDMAGDWYQEYSEGSLHAGRDEKKE